MKNDKIDEKLQVKNRQNGEKLQVKNRQKGEKLQVKSGDNSPLKYDSIKHLFLVHLKLYVLLKKLIHKTYTL